MSKKINKQWTTWFISDTHFGHKNVVSYCDRPFKDEVEMKEAIIRNINKYVKPEDLIVFVGDIFFYHNSKEMKETLDRINGRKMLVRGNHDKKPRQMMNAGFDSCVEEATMIIANEYINISHYPFAMPEWKYQFRKYMMKIQKKLGIKRSKWPEKYHYRRPKNKGQFLIHGHTHSSEKLRGRQIHVGVDAWNYKPVNIQDIANLISEVKKNEKSNK